jgi:hypothetical protein
MFELGPSDYRYDKGRRFRLDTVDGDEFYFLTQGDAEAFIALHGMKHITEVEMSALREALKNTEE